MADFEVLTHLAKQDPAGFFAWLWRHAATPLRYHSWLDARRSALPVEGDLTCDTVAAFHLADQAELSHALIVEFMAESRSNTLDRLLAYVVRARTEPTPAEGQTLPPQLRTWRVGANCRNKFWRAGICRLREWWTGFTKGGAPKAS